MKRTARLAVTVFMVVLTIGLACLINTGLLAYFYAGHLERNWVKANPHTKSELERHLHLYSMRQIKPSESLWANWYKLKDGERMVQYLILWNAPLDVVYDQNDNIKHISTSYE
jgi:hypothetical protein